MASGGVPSGYAPQQPRYSSAMLSRPSAVGLPLRMRHGVRLASERSASPPPPPFSSPPPPPPPPFSPPPPPQRAHLSSGSLALALTSDLASRSKSRGLDSSAVADMTASTPVCSKHASASAFVRTLPLAITGIESAALTSAIVCQSAQPSWWRCSRSRPWTASALTPACAARHRTHTKPMSLTMSVMDWAHS